MSSKTIGKFQPIICLDALDMESEGFYKVLYKLYGRIGAVFLKGFHETSSRIFISYKDVM